MVVRAGLEPAQCSDLENALPCRGMRFPNLLCYHNRPDPGASATFPRAAPRTFLGRSAILSYLTLAARVGVEPTTVALTVRCSAIELPGKVV